MIKVFGVGFIMAYLGLIPPGMLNMNACRISMEKGLKKAFIFSTGASAVVFLQSYVALLFAKFLNKHPDVLSSLKVVGIIVFLLLSYFFYKKSKQKFKVANDGKKENYFLYGFGLSLINMLGIPFYLAVSSYAKSKGWLPNGLEPTLYFVIGATLGAMALLATYSYFAKTILEKSQFLARNINIILSLLFLLLGILTFTKLFI